MAQIVYNDNKERIVIAEIDTDVMMSVREALEQLEIDVDDLAEKYNIKDFSTDYLFLENWEKKIETFEKSKFSKKQEKKSKLFENKKQKLFIVSVFFCLTYINLLLVCLFQLLRWLVAKVRLELTTFSVWGWRAANCSTSLYKKQHISKKCVSKQHK